MLNNYFHLWLFMAVCRNPPRLSKSVAIASSAMESDWFPEIKEPASEVHQQINTLNCQAYWSEMFAKADSFLILIAFVQKGKKHCHHAVKPEPAQPSASHYPLSKEDGILAARICKQHFSGSEPSWEAVVQSVSDLQDKISDFGSDAKDWPACLSQYASFMPLFPSPSQFSISLLYRYSLLYSSGSSIWITKVSHTSQEASFGLKATCDIPASTFIMETCSSMSLDCTSTPGPSVIESAPNQLGPIGPRLILGPFRLVNHDCKPNAQVSFVSFLKPSGFYSNTPNLDLSHP